MKKKTLRILVCIMFVCIVFSGCKKKRNQEINSIDTSVTPAAASTQSTEDTSEEQTDSESVEGDTTDSNSNEDFISDSQAIKLILDQIGERGYTIQLLDDQFKIGEITYFMYQISDSTSVIEPNVIVNKKSGEILCYYSDSKTAPFSEYPLFSEQSNSIEDSNQKFTKEDAYNKLSKLSAETLGLPVDISEYTIQYDDWTTNVNGVECYGINVYSVVGDKMINMGLYYVAMDGSKMFKFDSELDDFVEIVE